MTEDVTSPLSAVHCSVLQRDLQIAVAAASKELGRLLTIAEADQRPGLYRLQANLDELWRLATVRITHPDCCDIENVCELIVMDTCPLDGQ